MRAGSRLHDSTSTSRSLLAVAGWLVLIGLLAGGLALAAGATTMAGSQTISGTVTDVDTGEPIEDATVTVVKPDDTEETASTDADGSYSVTADQEGDYDVTAETADHDAQTETVTVSGSDETADFALGTTPRYEFTLAAGDVYAIGFPGPLEAESVDEIFERTDFQGVVYAYDESSGEWRQVVLGTGASADALDAIVVVVDEQADDVGVTMTFEGTAGADDGTPPDRSLDDGWNFVAPPQSNASEAFDAAEEILDQGASEPQSQQVEGEDDFDRHTFGTTGAPRVNPFKGYFVRTDGGTTVQAEAYVGITGIRTDGRLRLGSGSLEGAVHDSSGEPIEGASVTVTDTGQEATTGGDGTWHIADVPAGVTTLNVDAEGYSSLNRTVGVRVNETRSNDVELEELPTISGRVSDNKSGDPIEGATVVAERDADGGRETVDSNTTDANGNYSLAVPENDTYYLSIEATNHSDEEDLTVDVQQADVTENVTLEPLDGSIAGTVTDAKVDADDAIENATVTVELLDGGESVAVGSSTTGSNGTYRIGGLEPHEDYRIDVSAPDHHDPSPVERTVGANETVVEDFALEPLDGSIAGTITDAKLDSDDAIENATVTVTDRNGDQVAQNATLADGSYRLDDVPTNEELIVEVTGPDHEANVTTVALDANESRSGVDVELAPEDATIDGTITDSVTEEPVESGVEISIASQNSSFNVTGSTDDNGTYGIQVPAHETYDVTAGGGGSYVLESRSDIAVGAGDEYRGGGATENFTLDPENGTINGVVTDSNTSGAIQDVTVFVESQDSDFSAQVTTDDAGEYLVDAVPPHQTYNLTFEHADYDTANRTASVGPGEDVAVNVELDPLGYLRGTVLDGDGTAIEGATINVTADGDVVASARTDQTGEYETDRVAANTEYEITARIDGYTPVSKTRQLDDGENVEHFVLTENGTINGTVFDETLDEQGEDASIENATVTVVGRGTDFEAEVSTDENGSYTIRNVPTEFEYDVTAADDDHFANATNVTVEAGENVTLDLPLEPHNATIDGTVVDNVTDEGIANVTVVVESTETELLEPVFQTSTETNESGSYAVEVEPHAEYNISLDAPDHEDPATRTVEVGAGESYRGGGATEEYSLDPLGGSIVGTVTDNKTDEALEGATVTVDRLDDSGNVTESDVGNDTTTSDGSYAVEDLSSHEDYRVRVHATDHVDEAVWNVSLDPNEEAVLNVSLDPKNATISGVLTDSATGEPIVNATVEAFAVEDQDIVRDATTNGDGSFTIDDLPAHEDYRVFGIDEDYHDADPTDENQVAQVRVGANETVEDVAIELDPLPGTVVGTVTDAELEDGSERDAGIANVTVNVYESGDDPALAEPVATGETDEAGEYRTSNVSAGAEYFVEFVAADHEDHVDTSDTFAMAANGTVERNASLEPLDGTIRGMVTDNKTGDPVDATVGISSEDGEQHVRSTGHTIDEDDGEYVFDGVNASKTWTITVTADGYEDDVAEEFLEANGLVERDFQLEPRDGVIQGTVTDQETGDPIEGAAVVATDVDDGNEFSDTTDANGDYDLNVTSPATYDVSVSTPDHEDDNATVEVGSGETVTQDFPLVPLPAEVNGTVTSDTTDASIANVSVTIESSETDALGQPQYQATDETDGQGEYGFDSVDPHLNYTVTFQHVDYAEDSTQEFELGANESVERSRSLVPLDGSISGQVTDNVTGDAIEGATVRATNSSADIDLTTTTADDGTYTIADVPAERTYKVRVEDAANHSTPSDVNTTFVDANEDVGGVDFALEPLPAIVTGTVINASDDTAIEGAEVVVERLENGEPVEKVGSNTTDADGNYTVGGLDAHEDYRVTADAVDFTANASNVSLGPDETITSDFKLETAGYVRGTVVDGSGNAIEGATVTIIEPGGTFSDDQNVTQTTTDANGEYRTEEIPTGTYEIEFDHPDYVADTREIDVVQGENTVHATLQEA